MVDQSKIHRKVVSDDVEERREAIQLLSNNFADLHDKKEAWEDLIRLSGSDRRWVVRCWNNIKNWLPGDKNSSVRRRATVALGTAFQHVPDKDVAWEDLIRLTGDVDRYVRWPAAVALGTAFQHVPDKDTAWEDLHRLAGDEGRDVRMYVADALGTAFQHVPDKDAAWEDLQRLTGDKEGFVREYAVVALGTAFQHVPDKDEVWKYLHRLTGSGDVYVKRHAVDALGSAFQYVPDKDAAWEDLIRLTGDKDSDVRVSANHSLGRASIFKATVAKSEGDFESELNNAIDFFERSSNEGTYFNPSSFCLPFYRSFCKITFEKAEGEVHRYLDEAKSASKGSKNKETLLEAVENLANALSEAQKVTNFDATKSDLKTYMQYCNRAADLIGDASEGAPGAAQILRRGLPIIDQRIRELLEEVKKKSESICKAADLPESELGCRVGQHAATALATDNPLILEREIDHILNDLERWSHSIRDENERGYVQGIIFDAKNGGDARGKVSSIRVLLGRLLTFSEYSGEEMPKYDIRDSIVQIAEGNRNVQKMDSSVNSQKTETESVDVTVTTNVNATKELQPEEHRTDHRKKTAIEIIAAIAVSVLVGIVSSRYLEDLTPTSSTVIAFIAFIILLIIILTQNRDRSS